MSTLTNRIDNEIESAVESKNELVEKYREHKTTIEADIDAKVRELSALLDDLEHCDPAEVTNLKHEISNLKEDYDTTDVMLMKCLEKPAITPSVARGYTNELSDEFEDLVINGLKAMTAEVASLLTKCNNISNQYAQDYFPVHAKAYGFSKSKDEDGYYHYGSHLTPKIDYIRTMIKDLVSMQKMIEEL